MREKGEQLKMKTSHWILLGILLLMGCGIFFTALTGLFENNSDDDWYGTEVPSQVVNDDNPQPTEFVGPTATATATATPNVALTATEFVLQLTETQVAASATAGVTQTVEFVSTQNAPPGTPTPLVVLTSTPTPFGGGIQTSMPATFPAGSPTGIVSPIATSTPARTYGPIWWTNPEGFDIQVEHYPQGPALTEWLGQTYYAYIGDPRFGFTDINQVPVVNRSGTDKFVFFVSGFPVDSEGGAYIAWTVGGQPLVNPSGLNPRLGTP